MLRLSQQGFRKLRLRLFCTITLFSGLVIFLDDSTADQRGGDEYRPAETDSEFTFRVPVDVVVVNAVVSDESGHPVTDLTADDFEVYEDGELQSIQTFTRESYQRISVAEGVERGEEPEPRSVDVEDSGVGQARYFSLFIDDLTSPSPWQLYTNQGCHAAVSEAKLASLGPGRDFVRLRAFPNPLHSRPSSLAAGNQSTTQETEHQRELQVRLPGNVGSSS